MSRTNKHVDPNSMFAAFTEVQISMIATHIANGGYLAGALSYLDHCAIETICDTTKQAKMLEDYGTYTLHPFPQTYSSEPLAAYVARQQWTVTTNLEIFMESL